MKRILVTGARGFIGRYVAKTFANAGWHVTGIGHGPWIDREARAYGVTLWRESTITYGTISAMCKAVGRPDVVFHAAGGASVGQSVADPLKDFDRTVRTTAILMDAIQRLAPEAMLILPSSAAVYGMATVGPIKESDSPAPVSPYGIHKLMTEQLVTGAHQLFGLRYAIVRYFSLYGPGLQKQLLWDLCQKLSSQPSEILLFGSGTETRDFLHVTDAARLALHLVDRKGSPEMLTINGGCGCRITVRQVAETLRQHVSPRTQIRFSGRPRIGDPLHYQADVRLLESTGFRPSQDLDSGLAEYANWFLQAEGDQRQCA